MRGRDHRTPGAGQPGAEAVGAIPGDTVNVGGFLPVDVASYFTDPDGDELDYDATSSDRTIATVTVSGSTVTVEGEAAGTATITVTATDPDGLSATQSFPVTVHQPNRPPGPSARFPATP